ncbi:MAG: ABC transporter ATP-binding protein [Ktedonobacterales bacterium]|nr:ABC transporter ATP-binding protein [Ktedonobacterales bacterium]
MLDEALAQIDPWQAQAILAALDAERHDRITLVIAHRLAAAQSADRILVVADGRIADTGTHQELLARCPVYQRLAAAEIVEEETACVA